MEIVLHCVSVEFSTRSTPFKAIHNLTLEISKDEFVSVVGHSGCGKSTLLHLVAGFVDSTSGDVRFQEKEISGPSADRILVFQEDAVFPWYTVEENVGYGLRAAGLAREKRTRIARKYIDMVGLGSFADYYPKDLSGGMKKRVDLARAYAVNPAALLMDEPFGALDAYTRQKMQSELLTLWMADRKTVLFVTHDISEAVFMSDRVVVMTQSPGRVHSLVPVPFARPRQQQLKKTEAFLLLQTQIESLLLEFEGADATSPTI